MFVIIINKNNKYEIITDDSGQMRVYDDLLLASSRVKELREEGYFVSLANLID